MTEPRDDSIDDAPETDEETVPLDSPSVTDEELPPMEPIPGVKTP